ncbi:MAG: ADP-ribosylglycohydrolase family protein [Armatimonadetes bacterium]|nr:ADP-ribosylglycohydrolase family protein [Armatimonadota bacterium]
MADFIRAAIQGALVGATLGAPHKGGSKLRKLSFYEPIPARMAQSEALEAWLVWSQHIRSEKSAQTVSQSLLANWNYPVDESAFGLSNAARGLSSPISGSFANPLPTGSQAIGRAIYWGIAFHGDPNAATEYAYYDASIDHAGDGVWSAVALARMMASAAPGVQLTDLVRVATDCLPKESRILEALPMLMQSLSNPDGVTVVRETLASSIGVTDDLDASLTFSWILLGLLNGKGDFEPSVLTTAGCCGASGQSGLACGAISAALSGSVPEPWLKPLGANFVAGHGIGNVDPPATIAKFVDQIANDCKQFGKATAPAPPEPSPDAEAQEEEQPVAEPPAPEFPEKLAELLAQAPNESITEIENIRLSARYIDPPIVRPGKQLRMALTFTNIGTSDEEIRSQLTAPEGWKIATKLASTRLEPGQSTSFPAVVEPPKRHEASLANLRLKLNKYEVLIPIFGSQLWYTVGPFVNHDGSGYEHKFQAETKFSVDEIFNGRSDLPVQWSEQHFPGVVFDAEPLFKTGPGVVYLWSKAVFPKSGSYRLVAAAGVAMVVWLDGEKKLWYHDVHTPIPRPKNPYIMDFKAGDEPITFLFKILRNRQELPPVAIYFLAEDGLLVQPTEFLRMS